jgi:hypothetical protein
MIARNIKKMFPACWCIKPDVLALGGFFLTLFICSAGHAQTHNQRWYQVELIAFARQAEEGQENWSSHIKLGYPFNWVELKDPSRMAPKTTSEEDAESEPNKGPDLLRDAYYFLPDTDKKLLRYSNALKRDTRYRVLFHQAWRQFIGDQKKAPALLIYGGNSYGNHHELEGSITISVAQYLQIQTRLWLSQFELNYGQTPGDWPSLPRMPNVLRAEILAASQEPNKEVSQFDQWSLKNPSTLTTTPSTNETLANLSDPYLTKRIVLMEQERHMRSSELHYLDHPLFGLIIEITPYNLPAENPGNPR